jgi:hypothetical protein
MAHYAFLNEDNIVTEVIVGIDETELIEGLDTETWYGNFRNKKCLRTSYNANIRGNFAGIGYSYLENFDLFVSPKCHEEAVLNTETAKWDCANQEHEIETLA